MSPIDNKILVGFLEKHSEQLSLVKAFEHDDAAVGIFDLLSRPEGPPILVLRRDGLLLRLRAMGFIEDPGTSALERPLSVMLIHQELQRQRDEMEVPELVRHDLLAMVGTRAALAAPTSANRLLREVAMHLNNATGGCVHAAVAPHGELALHAVVGISDEFPESDLLRTCHALRECVVLVQNIKRFLDEQAAPSGAVPHAAYAATTGKLFEALGGPQEAKKRTTPKKSGANNGGTTTTVKL